MANVCPDDDRLASWCSSFQERAFVLGRWWGSCQLTRFCITNENCLVLPREIALIEAANFGGAPVNMRNSWYDIVTPHRAWNTSCGWSYGPTLGTCSCCGCGPMNLEQRDTVVSVRTTTGTNKKIRAYISNAVDVGKKLIFQGRDANGNWVRRPDSTGAVIDGEEVILANPFVDTVTIWGPGAPTGVIKDLTEYNVPVFSVNQDDASEVLLGSYQPSETTPTYQRIQLRGNNRRSCSGTACQSNRTLMAIAGLQPIPVVKDQDWLLFGNLTAYKMGIQAERYYEEGNMAAGDAYFFGNDRPSRNVRGVLRHTYGMGAIPILEAELRRMSGDQTTILVRQEGYNSVGFV